MTDDEIIAVVAAHKSGKKIEHRIKHPRYGQSGEWDEISIGMSGWEWNFLERDYRVAPEPHKPRDWFIHVPVECGKAITHGLIVPALSYESEGCSAAEGLDCIRVREVIQ